MKLKKALTLWVCVFGLISCKQNAENTDKNAGKATYVPFGKSMTKDEALDPIDAILQYEVMTIGDTIPSKIIAKVSGVCQAKGCWMILDLGDGSEIMVTFKDYEFFVPKDIADKEVIINGLAYIDDMSVEKQQHYAEDAGKTSADIANIVEPKRTWSFEADGILIKN